ncbi:DNA cytosine methyltransferase [Mariniblastus sp.]|nr:DNA cytosine methyltransferase [Mariniblastus sp.]
MATRQRPSLSCERMLALPLKPRLLFNCADLFSGAGGLAVGFHAAGFKCSFFNEIDKQAATTFAANNPSATPFVCPIEELTAVEIKKSSGIGIKDLDVVVGGPPCQGFSINAPRRSADDERNHLFRHYVRLVLEGIRPKFVLMENVPGLVSLDKGETLNDVVAAFQEAGYRVVFKILNAAHYGVPEERWRLFILGTRIKGVELSFPAPTHYSIRRVNFSGAREFTFNYAINKGEQLSLFDCGLKRPTTVAEAISDLPQIESGCGLDKGDYVLGPESSFQLAMRRNSKKLLNHRCNGIGPVNLERLKHIPQGGSWRDIPFDLLPAGMKKARRSDHTRRYGRFHPDEPSGTILTRCDPHWGTFYHYSQDRIISVREAARIQSFPDWFKFTGSCTDQYKQVGNAVPPLLAKAIAMHLRRLLERTA